MVNTDSDRWQSLDRALGTQDNRRAVILTSKLINHQLLHHKASPQALADASPVALPLAVTSLSASNGPATTEGTRFTIAEYYTDRRPRASPTGRFVRRMVKDAPHMDVHRRLQLLLLREERP